MKLLRYSKYDILIYMTLDIEIGQLETFIAIFYTILIVDT